MDAHHAHVKNEITNKKLEVIKVFNWNLLKYLRYVEEIEIGIGIPRIPNFLECMICLQISVSGCRDAILL